MVRSSAEESARIRADGAYQRRIIFAAMRRGELSWGASGTECRYYLAAVTAHFGDLAEAEVRAYARERDARLVGRAE